jgi:predicted nuclease of predicted toxin-antitoxin system
MRFLVDECAGSSLARWLHEQGYDVFSVYDQVRGINDDEVLRIAVENDRISDQFVVVTDNRVRFSSPED